MASSNSDFLSCAMRDGSLIGFNRRFEANRVNGYVLAVGPKFFVVAVVSDRIWFDGYECFRIADVRMPALAENARFIEAALVARGAVRPHAKIDVSSLQALLESASKAFPVIAIHREAMEPDVCWIGRVLSVKGGRLLLLEIAPDASWEKEPREFRLADITRVNFDGDYERALALVGGDPP